MSVLDVVAPLRCVGCGATGDDLCEACAGHVRILRPPLCPRCGGPGGARCSCSGLRGFGRARSLVAFEGPARGLVLALKRRGRPAVADGIGALLAELVLAADLGRDRITFVPGPASAPFDHAELLARSLARRLGGRPERLLRRTASGPRQADVPLGRRRSNVAGRFAAVPTTGRVLLVDDVFTTGATAEACAQRLRAAGATRVDVVTWARTQRRSADRRSLVPILAE